MIFFKEYIIKKSININNNHFNNFRGNRERSSTSVKTISLIAAPYLNKS